MSARCSNETVVTMTTNLRRSDHSCSSYEDFAYHVHTNAIGPIICAQRLLKAGLNIGCITFMSSDSSSSGRFRDDEDGFAAYGASKGTILSIYASVYLSHIAEHGPSDRRLPQYDGTAHGGRAVQEG